MIDTEVNGIPVVQAGSYLSYLGRLGTVVENKAIKSITTSPINLNEYDHYDADLASVIDVYNNAPEFDEIVGFSTSYLDRMKWVVFIPRP